MIRRLTLCSAILSAASFATAADFKKDVMPILKSECYKCHSEAEGKEKGDIVFDNLERFGKEIGAGKTVSPGDSKGSKLMETLVSAVDDDGHMPPKKSLGKRDIEKIQEWIDGGASLDGKAAPGAKPTATATPSGPATEQTWMDSQSRSIKATFLRMEGNNVIIQRSDGEVFSFPLDKLSPSSQELAKRGGR